MAERYDALVVGRGMAGLLLVLRTAHHGRVALVECELLGGTWLHCGCIPTKTMIASARVAHQVRRAAELGRFVGVPTLPGRRDEGRGRGGSSSTPAPATPSSRSRGSSGLRT